MSAIINSIPGWLIPVLILLVSILALSIIIDRAWWLFVKVKSYSDKDEDTLLEQLQSGEYKTALEFCSQKPHPAFRVAAVQIGARERAGGLEAKAESETLKVSAELQRFLPSLGSISTIAPLLGLLGTVTGMMKSFQAFDAVGYRGAKLMTGIDEALITTTFGLIVAIPSIIMYNYFVNRVNRITEETDLLQKQVSEQLNRVQN